MIRRDDADHWLLIPQPDHARLAGDLAAAWGNSQVAPLPHADLLLSAIRHHDDGWRDWERNLRIVPESGSPREFLEMPMAEATAIWNRSILESYRRERDAAELLDRFQLFLTSRSKRLTPDRTLVARMALSLRESFDADRVVDRVSLEDPERPYSRSTIYRTLGWLEEAGLLSRDARIRDRHVYRTTGAPLGPSPWGGLWVSRHFCTLAELALEHRRNTPEEAEPIHRFLELQQQKQREWRNELLGDLDVAAIEQQEESGFRWLQFFDRLSLWLCCAPRTLTEQMHRPQDDTIHFTPLKSGEIAVEPFPFPGDDLHVEVSAKRIPAVPFTSDAELQARYPSAPLETLQWVFVRW